MSPDKQKNPRRRRHRDTANYTGVDPGVAWIWTGHESDNSSSCNISFIVLLKLRTRCKWWIKSYNIYNWLLGSTTKSGIIVELAALALSCIIHKSKEFYNVELNFYRKRIIQTKTPAYIIYRKEINLAKGARDNVIFTPRKAAIMRHGYKLLYACI